MKVILGTASQATAIIVVLLDQLFVRHSASRPPGSAAGALPHMTAAI